MLGGGIGFQEVLVIGIVAVLLFGSRLPQVARTLGNSYQQFRKGLADLQSTINTNDINDTHSSPTQQGLPDYSDSYSNEDDAAPDFQPPPEEAEDTGEAKDVRESDPAV